MFIMNRGSSVGNLLDAASSVDVKCEGSGAQQDQTGMTCGAAETGRPRLVLRDCGDWWRLAVCALRGLAETVHQKLDSRNCGYWRKLVVWALRGLAETICRESV